MEDKAVMSLIASGKEQRAGYIRSKLIDLAATQFPDSSATLSEVTTAVVSYVNGAVGGKLLFPLFDAQGQPQVDNVDASGTQGSPITMKQASLLLP